MIEKFQSK